MEELKPCPFCGCKLEIARRKHNPYARCVTVDCKGSQLPMLNIELEEDVDRWNRRAVVRASRGRAMNNAAPILNRAKNAHRREKSSAVSGL